MQNDFEILAGFLDGAEPEVEGRALQEVPEAIKLKLRKFAHGGLPPAELAKLLGQLNQNRDWLSLLAHEVKALRPRNQSPHKTG
jgi:hypothetical protein